MAMMNADIAGVGEDEGEALDVVSSDDEEGIQLAKGKGKERDDSITVHYPLIPLPNRSKGKELRELLKGAIEGSDRAVAQCAQEWLDEIERVDKFPMILKKE